jgi:hypothetical protein
MLRLGRSQVPLAKRHLHPWERFTRGAVFQEPISSQCCASVQPYGQKPKHRLFKILQAQGHQIYQPITSLSDGGDTLWDLRLNPNLHAEYRVHGLHVPMRLTVLQQTAKGVTREQNGCDKGVLNK